jgi:arginyl-tRNA synthetase
MQSKIKNSIREALIKLNLEAKDIVVEHPADVKMGDYSTNIAMVLGKGLGKNPKDLATEIAGEINKNLNTEIEKVEAVGGFINFKLNKYFFQDSIKKIIENDNFGQVGHFAGKKFMVEYTDPNPFKPFHIGHLMTNAIGESIARIAKFSGAEVKHANYQGDVGLHVATAVWALRKYPEYVKNSAPTMEAAMAIGEAYAKGAKEYKENPEAKAEIDVVNKKIYDESDPAINAVYDWGFKVTMEAFEELYKMLGTRFDYYFLESDVAVEGTKLVKENMGKVFEESDGAIVFKADKYDPKLHTRVFITKEGLPTYEAKELGLTKDKFDKEGDMDLSIVTTANEQADYMRVVQKAVELIKPEYAAKMLHITHGMMRFAEGKMSSRLGNVITGESLLRDTKKLVEEKIKDRDFSDEERGKVATSVAVAAIKYGILKQSTKSDIIFDLEKATSFEGDSGPYLQYSYARARSILAKGAKENLAPNFNELPEEVTEVEKLLYRFPEVVGRSAENFEPHYIANYLIELARTYNTFYGNTLIINKEDAYSPYKLALTEAFSLVLKRGLNLLGIESPEKM